MLNIQFLLVVVTAYWIFEFWSRTKNALSHLLSEWLFFFLAWSSNESLTRFFCMFACVCVQIIIIDRTQNAPKYSMLCRKFTCLTKSVRHAQKRRWIKHTDTPSEITMQNWNAIATLNSGRMIKKLTLFVYQMVVRSLTCHSSFFFSLFLSRFESSLQIKANPLFLSLHMCDYLWNLFKTNTKSNSY